ncbi:hypothetical protein KL86SPO_70602 [uncultured Sporomusa sp.]|uniref:N-acetyltransferase domain-containing protein n=2 Tax=uncultured Sporomusa sp. TaxID=307249 RepID=A0A212M1P6_9FIRM|nr:hypothetical protein KL86SPO_70602 [uncultured Sporomusa sp.]
MDNFLKRWALMYDSIGEGKTWILHDKDNKSIAGFFTLKCSSIPIYDEEMGEEPKNLPAIEISRFAIEKKYQDKHIGTTVFTAIIYLINKLKEEFVGVRLITLFAIPNPKVIHLYKNFEFVDDSEGMDISKEDPDLIFMYRRI